MTEEELEEVVALAIADADRKGDMLIWSFVVNMLLVLVALACAAGVI